MFGFLDKETLDLFELLITVNGVGPKAALNILSRASLKDLMSAINESDVNFLSSLPSLGKKTAEKIILDLKGKISLDINIGNWSEVRSALVNLGYSNIEVDSIYSVFKEKYGDSTDLSNSVRMAISLLKGDKKNYE